MQYNEEAILESRILETAKAMVLAAKTAPKARGIDNLFLSIITGEEITGLSNKMKEVYEQTEQHFFLRDSENILSCKAVVLIGTKIDVVGLDCGLCGFATCQEKYENSFATPCMFNSNDLGIALGSAVSIAADNRLDNRIMYSAGKAAKLLGYFPENVAYGFAIPLSANSKSPFFDRPTIQQPEK